jgi:hypothetical protein
MSAGPSMRQEQRHAGSNLNPQHQGSASQRPLSSRPLQEQDRASLPSRLKEQSISSRGRSSLQKNLSSLSKDRDSPLKDLISHSNERISSARDRSMPSNQGRSSTPSSGQAKRGSPQGRSSSASPNFKHPFALVYPQLLPSFPLSSSSTAPSLSKGNSFPLKSNKQSMMPDRMGMGKAGKSERACAGGAGAMGGVVRKAM